MINIELASRFLQAIPQHTRVCFVGDVDQLPPVGPGSFFGDIIRSGTIPTFYLKTNHRQGAGSMIAENALRINRGELNLRLGNSIEEDDLILVKSPDPISMRVELKKVLKQLKPIFAKNFHDRVQVLSPQRSGKVGIKEINNLLRFWMNARNARVNEPLSVGDKVMQVKNDYELDLMNGDVGKIVHVQANNYIVDFSASGKGHILYPRIYAYPGNPSKTNMVLCYCSTVHKFQGSECEAGVVIVSSSHRWMLTRNLLYTAITRFRKKCVILADEMALKRAITNDKEKTRYSKLIERMLVTN